MRVFVTGASGFVGRQLCGEAIKQGFEVICGRANTDILIPGVKIIDTGDLANLNQDFYQNLQGIDAVIHLAGRAHKMNEISQPPEKILELYRATNVRGTINLANAALKAGVKRFVYLSSVKAAGEESQQAFTVGGKENPEDSYGISKLEAEKALKSLCSSASMEFVIVRPPLIYGPEVRANFLKLIQLVDRHLPFPFARIDNTRSYVYIYNLIDAILTLISHPKAGNQIFYVADERKLSITDLVKLISFSLGKKPRLFYFPKQVLWLLAKLAGKQQAIRRICGNLVVDTSLIHSQIGWKPKWSIEEGIDSTTKWYKTTFRKIDI